MTGQRVEVGPPPPFDEACASALTTVPEWIAQPVTLESIEKRRTLERATTAAIDNASLRRNGTFQVDEKRVPGRGSAPDVGLLICRPTSADSPTPLVLHIHGGGMVGGSSRTTIAEVLDWAEALELTVASVEYRLAPESRYPAQVEDCYSALEWVVAHAAELKIDPTRVVLAGVSAGGGLAAAVALMARDIQGPALLGQLLTSPMLDDRNDSVSARQMAGSGVWDRSSNETGWAALLGEQRGAPDVSPYAAPARATDLSGLPPAFIDVGSAETFRDEDVAYATRLWQAGGSAELHVWPGGFHGFSGLAPHARIAQEAVATRRRWLQRLLHRDDQGRHRSP